MPLPDRPDAFGRGIALLAALDPSRSSAPVVRTLFAIRWKLGALLGLDRPDAGLGSRVLSLRDRLPADLRDGPTGPHFANVPFTPLYVTDDEWAAEAANATMHGVIHVGRIDGNAGPRAQLAIYVKTNGRLGNVYMAAIKPFRHLLVYPAMLAEFERALRAEVVAT